MTINKTILKTAAGAALLMAFQMPSFAIDSASLEVGTGNKTTVTRAALQWDWQSKWWQSNGTHIGGYWDLSAANWHSTRYNGIDSTQNLIDIGITPVFRFQRDSKTGPYLEGGIGLHVTNKLYNSNGKNFSTAFQFGDHISVGYVFDNGLDLGLRIQHLSNGDIKQPNSGVNYMLIRAAYRF